MKLLKEYENAILVFDDVSGSSNSRYIEQFFIRGRHDNLDIYCLSQSFFDSPKTTIRNNSNKILLFNQTLKDVENLNRDVGGYDMSYDEFVQICRETWKEEYIYLRFDGSKKRDQARNCNCNESKNTYTGSIPGAKSF